MGYGLLDAQELTVPSRPRLDDVNIVRSRTVYGRHTCQSLASIYNGPSPWPRVPPTAICRPEINTHHEPVPGRGAAQGHAARDHAAIGAWVEGGGYAAPSGRECAFHRMLPLLYRGSIAGRGDAVGVERIAWAARGAAPRGSILHAGQTGASSRYSSACKRRRCHECVCLHGMRWAGQCRGMAC